jgi:hypothetical protein
MITHLALLSITAYEKTAIKEIHFDSSWRLGFEDLLDTAIVRYLDP